MTFIAQTEAPPLREDATGALRVGNSRVLLELVIRAFQDGATPDTIVQRYSTLALSDVYPVIAYYLRLVDENFSDILRGLLLRRPDLGLVCVQDIGLAGADDPDILVWAAENKRIVLKHDRATMSDYAYERVAAGEAMAGVSS